MDAYDERLALTLQERLHTASWYCDLCGAHGIVGATLGVALRPASGLGHDQSRAFFRCSDKRACAERAAA